MKKLLLLSLLSAAFLTAKAQYQFPNSDFEEDFISSYGSYTEPRGWHGYASISGAVGSMGRSGEKLCQSDDERAGGKAVYVKSTSVWGIIANGVMTNGQIYSGSISATDGSGNYNFSDSSNTGNESTYGENNQFYTPFTGRPDSMRVWLKFVPAADNTGNARVSVYTHKEGTVMYDPTDNVEDMSIVVAHAEKAIPASDEWVQYSLPFTYSSDEDPGLILATFSTNETAGKGSDGDYLYIDDIEMVYVSELSMAKYAGEDIEFDEEGKASVDALYSPKLLKYAAGVVADVQVTEPTEDNDFTMTIVVTGSNIADDPTNTHTYTIQFAGLAGDNYVKDEVEVPEIVSSDLADGRFYLYNIAVEGYLNTDDALSESAERYWTISQDDGTVFSEDGTYLLIDRTAYSEEFDSSLVPVTSSQTDCGDGKEFTFSQGDGFVEMYRKEMKYYDSEAWLFATKYHSNVFAGAESMTELASYYTGKDTYETTSGVENTRWMLVAPALYLANYFSNEAETATLSEGVSFSLAVFNDCDTTELTDMPAGIYAIDNEDKFYYDGESSFEITSSDVTINYYGLLDLAFTVQYDGETIEDSCDKAYDESHVTVIEEGNGIEEITQYYDPEAYTLTVMTTGYGKVVELTYQFAAPDLSLNATWNGEEIEDEAVLYAAYDADKLEVTAGEGGTVDTQYDEETGVLTITITAVNDETSSETYTISFVTPDLSLNATLGETVLSDGLTVEGSYKEEELTITTTDGTVVTSQYEETESANVLTIIVSAKDDESLSATYTITFDTPTGISSLNAEAGEEDAIYDLSGRRLSQKQAKGIYIINGKKVLAK